MVRRLTHPRRITLEQNSACLARQQSIMTAKIGSGQTIMVSRISVGLCANNTCSPRWIRTFSKGIDLSSRQHPCFSER